MKQKLLLIAIILSAVATRLLSLDKIPNSLTPDEAAQGYTAYSILKTGKDEWNNPNLFSLRSYGDYKPPFQTFLMVPSIQLFGLNTFAVRLPSALAGILLVLAFYLLGNIIFNPSTGLIAATLAAFSPWLLPLSRLALEANIVICVFAFAFYFFLKYQQNHKLLPLIISAVLFGLTPFIYHSGKIITPLFLIILFFYFQKKMTVTSKAYFSLIIIFLFIANYFLGLTGSQNRASDIAIFHPTDNWSAVSDHRFELTQAGLNPPLARLIANKLLYTVQVFFYNYLNYFSFHFWLTEGVSETTYGMMPGRGVLGVVATLGLVYIFYLYLRRSSEMKLSSRLLFWLLFITPLPSALAKGQYSGNRTSLLSIPLLLLSAYGIYLLSRSKIHLIKYLLLIIFSGSSVLFLFDYYYHANTYLGPGMLYGHQELNRYLKDNPGYNIIYSRKLSEPQAYYLYYQSVDPKITQLYTPYWLEYESRGLSFLDQLGQYHLPGVTFKEISYTADSALPKTIIAGRPEEFPANITPSFIIAYPSSSRAAIWVVKTDEITQ